MSVLIEELHRYKLLIQKNNDTNSETADGGTNYSLIDLLEDIAAHPNTSFTLVVFERGNMGLAKVEDNLYRYGGGKLVTCKTIDYSGIEVLKSQQGSIHQMCH